MSEDELKDMQKKIKLSYEVVKKAHGDKTKAISYGLRKIGKRNSIRWVRKQAEFQDSQANYYENFKRWMGAFILADNIEGVELILKDLEDFISEVEKSCNVESNSKMIKIDSNLLKYFPDSNAINEALRFLARITKEHRSELTHK